MLDQILRASIDLVPWKLRTQVKRWPIVAPLQRWAVRRFLANAEFMHRVSAGPAKGLRCWVRLPEDKAVWTGTYESEFAQELAREVRLGDTCLDVGGFRGFLSGVLALRGADEVHIFEPLPGNIERIRNLMGANSHLPLRLHELAVGEYSGRGDFIVMPEESMGKLTSSRFQEQTSGKEKIQVRIETLDQLVFGGRIPIPTLVKIDVEGAEAMVLRGGQQVLREYGPRLFIEIHSRSLARECNELLAQSGYQIRVLESKCAPNYVSEPEICHFSAVRNRPRDSG